MKKNILVLNRIRYSHYCKKDGQPILDPETYNVIIATEKNQAQGFPSKEYVELHAFDLDEDQRVFEFAKEMHSRYNFDRVIALSERNLLVAGQIRDFCGIEGLSSDTVLGFRDKCVMKTRLQAAGIKVPAFRALDNFQFATDFLMTYKKVVIKPKAGMGSQNTYIIQSESYLKEVYSMVEHQLEDYEIEEFIEGDMYHCDSIIENGTIKLCSFMKYMDSTLTFSSNFRGGAVMEENKSLQESIKQFNQSVIQALGLKNGITHHEFFVDDNQQITFCEIGARAGGGGIVPAIEQAYSVNMFQAALCLELGHPLPEIKKTGLYSGYIFFTPKKGRVEEISSDADFEQPWIPLFKIIAQKGDLLGDPQNSADLIAYFIVVGETPTELMERIHWIEENFKLDTVD